MKTHFLLLAVILLAICCVIGCEKETHGKASLSAELVSHTGCKNKKTTVTGSEIPDTLSCVEYNYDVSEKKLKLKHINAGFNCCPGELSCSVNVVGDTMIIGETEEEGSCDCLCLYDLDVEVSGIEAKAFVIKFIEPYWQEKEKLIFNVDLGSQSSGSYCMVRKQYPWIEF
ncbi:MAG: hypothetical protein R6W78_12595 [Bacteroidales bacterium]